MITLRYIRGKNISFLVMVLNWEHCRFDGYSYPDWLSGSDARQLDEENKLFFTNVCLNDASDLIIGLHAAGDLLFDHEHGRKVGRQDYWRGMDVMFTETIFN